MASFIAGDFIRFAATFSLEPGGSPSDPGFVVFIYAVGGMPSTTLNYVASVSTIGDIIRDSAGVYHVDLDTTGNAGTWVSEWASQGAPQAVSTAASITVSAPWVVPTFP